MTGVLWFRERLGREGAEALLGRAYEGAIARVAEGVIRPGSLVVDGGCHAGMHALRFAQLAGPVGLVLAVDPLAEALADAQRWHAATGRAGRLRWVQAALGGQEGEAVLHHALEDPQRSSLRYRHHGMTYAEQRVRLTTLDALLPEGEAAFVKLDLEGAEFPALRGAKALLRRSRCPVVFENGRGWAAREFGYAREDFFAFFAALGHVLHDGFGRPFGPEQWESEDVGWYCWSWPADWPQAASTLAALRRFWAIERDAVLRDVPPSAPRRSQVLWFVDRLGEPGYARLGEAFERLIDTVSARLLGPGSVAVDGGANAGRHTIPFAERVAPHGRVHAIEPHGPTVEHCRRWAAGSWAERVVHWHQAALWDAPGTARFGVATDSIAHSSLRFRDPKRSYAEEEVALARLDDLLPATRVDFIKLDVEGAEFHALRGARRLLRESGCPVVFENARGWAALKFGYTREDFFSLFDALDYTLFDGMGEPFGPWAWEGDDVPWYFWAWPRGWAREAEVLALIRDLWERERAAVTDQPR